MGAVRMDYASAIRADPGKQNYLVCPRHWYVDAEFVCKGCRRHFTWTAAEQKTWFEDYDFWIDSCPRHCRACGADRRHLAALRAEYDSTVAAARPRDAIDRKIRVIEIVHELESAFGCLPEKMIETREQFELQVRKARESGS